MGSEDEGAGASGTRLEGPTAPVDDAVLGVAVTGADGAPEDGAVGDEAVEEDVTDGVVDGAQPTRSRGARASRAARLMRGA